MNRNRLDALRSKARGFVKADPPNRYTITAVAVMEAAALIIEALEICADGIIEAMRER